ncbi:MAG: hypothetical protein ACRCXT_15780 [Paraclostridium sp.]
MRIYIVVWQRCEFVEIEKAFKFKESAEEYINKMIDKHEYFIEELELDTIHNMFRG